MVYIRKIASVILCAVILLATAGFTVNRHYCGGKLKSTQLYSVMDPKTCCGVADLPEDKQECPEGCCHDKVEFYQFDEDFNLPATVVNPNVVIVFINYFLLDELFGSLDPHTTKYLNYKPPLIELDIPVLVQSFLI